MLATLAPSPDPGPNGKYLGPSHPMNTFDLKSAVQEFLAHTPPFGELSAATQLALSQQFQPQRFPMGRGMLAPNKRPSQFYLIFQGQVRLLGRDQNQDVPPTLKMLQPGEAVGWSGLVRQHGCEGAIASTDTIALVLTGSEFLAWLAQEPHLDQYYRERASLAEVYELLGHALGPQALEPQKMRHLLTDIYPQAQLKIIPATTSQPPLRLELEPDYRWLLSSGTWPGLEIGQSISPTLTSAPQNNNNPVRLIGLPIAALPQIQPQAPAASLSIPAAQTTIPTTATTLAWEMIPEAPLEPPEPELTDRQTPTNYPFIAGKGSLDASQACFAMLAEHFNLPFRKDIIRRVLENQLGQQDNKISLTTAGVISELMGLRAQLLEVPKTVIQRVPTPFLACWDSQLLLVYEISAQGVVVAAPEQGLLRQTLPVFLAPWDGETISLIQLEKTGDTPQKKFDWRWFLPAIQKHRRVLIEVFIASFFVQLFGLANPLVTQVIIDKVLVKNSPDSLHVLGILLVVVAVFEALLSSFRTYLFVDTTNRIDLTLGTQVIDHLLRLPLKYFDRRPVGELATRVNELENIRQFLTGTALTVVLDAVFSVIYIVVMILYSWLLTLIALATVPIFGLLTFIFSPVIRNQVRVKAERNAETQAYFTEVITGIQTVKSQNIELKSRWQWQDRYSRFVSAGFNAVITSTTAGSMSRFLSQLSNLLLLWVGAYLVLEQKLTLGELIAFRILAGYATSPLLRLIQLWQNFQETALSLERLSDILDSPQEVKEEDRGNIPLPAIQGAICFQDVCFSFAGKGNLQLKHIHLNVEPGTFVGIVGQSGSGKSTLMKLLMRLYEVDSGQITIDQYDVSKVDLYSLRQQVGMVLQDSLLFDGTVQDNIALARPDATPEEIVTAAKLAYAHDFIMDLPVGYNSRVGERGAALSGGQRQRIAIARVILQDPRLLILDEATSALDYLAEHTVFTNLRQTFGDRTVFFVTHRLRSLVGADRIVMMDQGTVVEQGTHAELMDLRGQYYCLYQQQEAAAV
nr:peptidase domain-containing ABC transporter [Synechococcus sp. PCC 6312]